MSLHNLALGSERKKMLLQVNASAATNSLLETDGKAAPFWDQGILDTIERVDVDVTTLDEFCRENGIEKIDVLKLDIQGSELEALRGAKGLLSQGNIGVIYTEMLVAPSYKGQFKPLELFGFLDGLGYDLLGLYNFMSRNDGRLLQMDAIFVQSDR
jgi:FkbM family methyltransferase